MRGCDDLICRDDVCPSYIGKRFHAALVIVECLSAAITQRHTEADGPHMRGDGPESAYGMVSLCKVQWLKCATRLMMGTESNATRNPTRSKQRHCADDPPSVTET